MTPWTETGRVAEALRQAGIETWEVREVSPNHDGVILTQALAKGIWQQETGEIRCDGHCRNEPGAPQHMTREELSTDQQETFTSDLARDSQITSQITTGMRDGRRSTDRSGIASTMTMSSAASRCTTAAPPSGAVGRRRGPRTAGTTGEET